MTTVSGTTHTRRTETRRLPRSTGALSGLLVILLGIWGGLIPFVGPYFHYAFGSYKTWHYTSERLWLCIVPGAVAVIGGLMLMRSSRRSSGLVGGWLAVAAGAWFAIGPSISLLWHHSGNPIGAPMGGHTRQAIEWLGYFSGLGVAIAALAAFAMGRYFSRPRMVEEAAMAADDGIEHERMAHEPIAEREAPVAATAAGGALAAHEAHRAHEDHEDHEDYETREPGEAGEAREAEPLGARDEDPATRANEPVASESEPVARGNEPVARGNEPVAGGNEPVAAADAPVARADEHVAPANDPVPETASPRADESAARADDPIAPANEPAAAAGDSGPGGQAAATGPESSTGPASVTYRRRPGLSRFRRR